MNEIDSYIPRSLLDEAFGGNPRLVRAFEDQAIAVAETEQKSASTASATEAIQDAFVLSLSANASFNNERIFTPGEGIEAIDDGELLTVKVDTTVPRIDGGHGVTLLVTAPTTLLLPPTGTLATREGAETLANKSLDKPRIGTFGDYADDSAAASGGVPVGGVYRNGSQLMVRVA